jgi:hypothetical protein
MPRIPYEQIAPEANRLFAKITTAKDLEDLKYWTELYEAYLAAVGWDSVSFDQESARRVDEDWEDKKPIIWN